MQLRNLFFKFNSFMLIQPGNSSCVTDFTILTAVETKQLDGLIADGILGLAPSSQQTDAVLFIDALKEKRVISKKVFGIHISPVDGGQSVVTIGGINETIVGNKTITYHKLANTNYWSTNLVSVFLRKNELKISTHSRQRNNSRKYSSLYVDSAIHLKMKHIKVLSSEFEQLKQIFGAGYLCGMDNNVDLFLCQYLPEHYDNLPDIEIQIDSQVYYVPKESYVQISGSIIYFLIMSMEFPTGKGLWILGDNFLQNYYAVFDHETDPPQVGLVGEKVQYRPIALNALDYVYYLTLAIFFLFIAYAIYEQCFKQKGGHKGSKDGYRELPGDMIPPSSRRGPVAINQSTSRFSDSQRSSFTYSQS